jgi:hypothetical protein
MTFGNESPITNQLVTCSGLCSEKMVGKDGSQVVAGPAENRHPPLVRAVSRDLLVYYHISLPNSP